MLNTRYVNVGGHLLICLGWTVTCSVPKPCELATKAVLRLLETALTKNVEIVDPHLYSTNSVAL